MSMIRKLMRNVARSVGARSTMRNAPAVGSQRAGMHQKAEYEFQHSRMEAGTEHYPETAENALDMPAAVEAEIPPVEEDDDEVTADIAEGEAEIAPEAEILEDVADPEAAAEEEEAKADQFGMRNAECGIMKSAFSVDYSGERIPVLNPVTGGNGTDGSAELVYSSGDGSLKEIQEPLPGMERLGVMPYMPGVENPSANVAATDPEEVPDEPVVPDDPDVPDVPEE